MSLLEQRAMIDGRELRVLLKKGRDLILVLLAKHGAGYVDEPAARFHIDLGIFEDLGLLGPARVELLLRETPFGVRAAPPGAASGARSIDHDEVHSFPEIG